MGLVLLAVVAAAVLATAVASVASAVSEGPSLLLPTPPVLLLVARSSSLVMDLRLCIGTFTCQFLLAWLMLRTGPACRTSEMIVKLGTHAHATTVSA